MSYFDDCCDCPTSVTDFPQEWTVFPRIEQFSYEDDEPAGHPSASPMTPVTENAGLVAKSAIDIITEVATYPRASFPSTVITHDPDGLVYLPNAWPTWDGTTTLDPCGSLPFEIRNWVWPASSPAQMRGLRDMYYLNPPFKNVLVPTLLEIEKWNTRVIELYRRLLGVTTPITPSRNSYLLAHWSHERKYGTYWDSDFPGVLNTTFGRCDAASGATCGSSFMPTCPKQEIYLQAGEPCAINDFTHETLVDLPWDIPWCIMFSLALKEIIDIDGISGRAEPFLSSPSYGVSFHLDPSTQTVNIRIKWRGSLINPC